MVAEPSEGPLPPPKSQAMKKSVLKVECVEYVLCIKASLIMSVITPDDSVSRS